VRPQSRTTPIYSLPQLMPLSPSFCCFIRSFFLVEFARFSFTTLHFFFCRTLCGFAFFAFDLLDFSYCENTVLRNLFPAYLLPFTFVPEFCPLFPNLFSIFPSYFFSPFCLVCICLSSFYYLAFGLFFFLPRCCTWLLHWPVIF